MKKYMIGLIVAVFTVIAVLPTPIKAAEAKEEVKITDNGDDTVKVSLTMPNAAVKQISTVKITLIVEPKNTSEGTVTFEFAKSIQDKAKVTEYRYYEDSSYLNIYVSGTTPLFKDGEETIAIGNISGGKDFKVEVIEDSLTAVVGYNERAFVLADLPVVKVGDGSDPDDPDRPAIDEVIEDLENTITEAESLPKGDYTESSYNDMLKALENAKNVLADPASTEEQIRQALSDLQNAIGALVKNPDNNSAQDKLEQDIADNKVKDPNMGSGDTGNSTTVWPWVSVVVVSGAVIGAFLYWKQKEKATENNAKK